MAQATCLNFCLPLTKTPFTFIGQKNYYRDSELDLYLAGARYYDPLAGRWLSEDPKRYEAGDSNLYRYVSNNPVNNIGPTGKEGWASIEDLRVFAPTAKEIRQYQQRTHQELAEYDRTVGLEHDLPPRTPKRVGDVAYPYRQKLFQHYRQQGVNGEVVYNSDGDAVGAIFSRRSDYLTREQAGDNTYSTWEHDKDYHRFDLYSFDDNGFNGSFLGSAVVGPMQYVRQEYRQQRIAPSHEPAMIPGVSNVGAIVANAQKAIRMRQAVGIQHIATLPVSSMKTAESNGSFVSNAESSGYHEDVSGYLDRMNAQEDVLRTGMSSQFAHQQDRGQVILTGRQADVLHFTADTGEAAIVVAEFAPGGGVGVWLGKAASGDQEHEATLANLGWAVLADLLAAKAVGIVAKWIRGRLVVEGADGRTVEFTKEAIEEARARLKNSGLAGTDEEVERYVRLSLEHGEDADDLVKAGSRVGEGIAPTRVGDPPYNPHAVREALEQRYPGQVTSTTVPPVNPRNNVHLAGTRHHTGIVFDQRGFPIFDDVAKVDLHISAAQVAGRNYRGQMRAATRALRAQIDSGAIPASRFTPDQIRAINSGLDRIPGYTWHHHQYIGRMQLVPRQIHKDVGHIGGFEMWYGR